jgi:hypothetical protein
MSLDEQAALIVAFNTAEAKIRAHLVAYVLGLFGGLGSWRDRDRDRFAAQVAPVVAGAQRQVASLMDAYLTALLSDMRGTRGRPTGAIPDVSRLRGVDPLEVYGRPFVDVWAELADGRDLSQALAAGRLRAEQITTTDLQLAKTHTARARLEDDPNVVGYRRVLTGSQSCGLCVVASTQRYHRSGLLPIHPGCDCGVAPIVGDTDPGQVINGQMLEDVHDAIQQRFGVSDRSGRQPIDYRNLLVTHEHGEIGPVLARAGQDFTGPDDLGESK